MKTIRTLALCGLLLLPTLAFAQEGQMPPMGPPEELESLEFLLGDWTVDVKMREGPDTPWMESTATANHHHGIGGVAVISDFNGNFMGMEFIGRETLTYNREAKQFESFWIDSMSAKATKMTGGWEGDKFVMSGVDSMMGEKVHMRSTSMKNADGTVTFSMEMSMDGENWFENMQMVYTKKS